MTLILRGFNGKYRKSAFVNGHYNNN